VLRVKGVQYELLLQKVNTAKCNKLQKLTYV